MYDFEISFVIQMMRNPLQVRKFNGNAQFLFLCNPQKSLVNVCPMKILKSTVTKESKCVFL